MLIITRDYGQRLKIGEHIELTILEATDDQVRIGIQAPADIAVIKEESQYQKKRE